MKAASTARCLGLEEDRLTLLKTALIVATVLLAVLLGWQMLSKGWLQIEIAFAEEQTRIFEDMHSKASEALSKNPPDVRAAIEFMQYAYRYYPSGTKQTQGTRLDRIVERARGSCVDNIISDLRRVTGRDLGEQPEPWIASYLKSAPANSPPPQGKPVD